VTDYPSCVSSENVICKHARATKTFYVDLDWMPAGVTASDPTADTADASLTVEGVSIQETSITVDPSQGCAGYQLVANRAILVILSGGVASDDEVIVVVNWVQSDGTEDSRECRVLVQGTA